MNEDFYSLLDAAVSEARSDSLGRFKKMDGNYRRLSERGVSLSTRLSENLPDETKKLYGDYIDCMSEIHSIELNREYREGIKHCLQLMRFLGFTIGSDTDMGEKIAKILLEQIE